MANLNHLKIGASPAAFAPFAAKHNALVDLIASLEGSLGLDVQIASSPPPLKVGSKGGVPNGGNWPKGKIKLSFNPTAVAGGVGGGAGGGGSVGPNGTVQVVGINGLLVPAVEANANYTGLYPTVLGVQTNGTSPTCIIVGTQVTHNMSVHTFVGCNSGNAGNYLVVASDFF